MLTGISILCFGASYTLAWVLEWIRLRLRSVIPQVASTVLVAAGLLAHTLYAWTYAREAMDRRGAPVASWFHWCVMAAWGLALFCLGVKLYRPQTVLGVFLLPMVLVLVGMAAFLAPAQQFAEVTDLPWVGVVHGVALLVGTVAANVGFVTGLAYLWESDRLKRKLPIQPNPGYPSLEWLERVNERSLMITLLFLLAGVVLGMVLNWESTRSGGPIPWSDPTLWTSAMLMAWILAVLSFLIGYRPARRGRKVAYLTIASFVCLLGVLSIILLSPSSHARRVESTPAAASSLKGPLA